MRRDGKGGERGGDGKGSHNLRKTTPPRHQMAGYGPDNAKHSSHFTTINQGNDSDKQIGVKFRFEC